MDYEREMQKSFLAEVEQIRKQVIVAYEHLRRGNDFKAKIHLITTIQNISDLENIIEKDIKIEATDANQNSF